MGCSYSRRSVVIGNHRTECWNRRNNRHRSHNRSGIYHHIIVSVLAVTLATPALAEGETSVISRPTAAATSNNTNQSVQFNNHGAPSRQNFGAGVSCNGSTLNVTPFYLGNDTIPFSHESYVRSNNWGMQFGFSIPLDGSITEMCKDLVRRQLQRERMDYELVRATRCAKLMELGYTFRPDSAMHVACADVVSISAWRHFQPDSSPVILQDASTP